MNRQYKLMWRNDHKDIRKQMLSPNKDRAVMDYDVKRPGTVTINGKTIRYEGP